MTQFHRRRCRGRYALFARSLQYEEIIPVDQSRSARYKSPGFLILVCCSYLPRQKLYSVSSDTIPQSVLVLYQLDRLLA
ncbi:hypothetical protein BDV40DRAFT_259499 [Aspergillus tamarii]|uniref:Uncharacterized protein n=1 Tax=Aspergillus tamarii TaxID=41984 RepID=A0A5N6V1U4_ASPTM|nr:hypothetical protein BDV40DRAFT_259499 [Aspergillus tamarii]